MMKRTGILLAILLIASVAQAQFLDELLRPKETQIKYLKEQIVALQVYIGHVQKTYTIAKDGLTFIGKASKGEFDLHNDFFVSLKNVNPEVRKYPKVADIAALQAEILKNSSSYQRQLNTVGTLSIDELGYVKAAFDRIQDDCNQVIDELKIVITSSKLEMKDDERIARINAIHQRMQENYLINQSFGSGALQLAIFRSNEKDEIRNSRILNGIKE